MGPPTTCFPDFDCLGIKSVTVTMDFGFAVSKWGRDVGEGALETGETAKLADY